MRDTKSSLKRDKAIENKEQMRETEQLEERLGNRNKER